MKKCPYCAEEIQDAAIKCKHCHEFLNGTARPHPNHPATDNSIPWYCRTSSLVMTFFCMPPLALPLIWLHPKMKLAEKLIWSLITIAITALIVAVIIWSMKYIIEFYDLIGSFQADIRSVDVDVPLIATSPVLNLYWLTVTRGRQMLSSPS